ncbi:hypothetical protein CPB86DRAFT_877743 [Serendipita vermifera]|nr:hypothetical protein CPB86DRAFT_877743 [Serendipita vermifera]
MPSMTRWNIFDLVFIVLFILPVAYAGKVKVVNNPQIRVATSLANFDARIVDAWSKGGGSRWTIGNDSSHPFHDRQFGGARRHEIRGSRAYGSGYPYGNDNPSTISGRPFPFGLWPIYWDQDFLGCDEYGPQVDTIRPGGQLVTIPLKNTDSRWNVTADEVYYAIGDRDSVMAIMISLVTWCHATPAWPSKFDPTNPNSTIKIENVLQYYRASSFALAFQGYNNTFARVANTSATLEQSAPIPDLVRDSGFWECLDAVTANALAIMNRAQSDKPEQTIGGIMAGVFGSLGLFILALLGWLLVILYLVIVACIKGIANDFRERRQRRIAIKENAERLKRERLATLAYENYP